MKVEFYGHVRQYQNIQKEIDANIKTVLESGQYVMGPMLKQFEAELAAYHGTKYAVGLGNGTDAIWLALMALGIGPGDEVITHPNTFFATAEAIWIAGATAVFVDCAQDQVHLPGRRSKPPSRPRPRPSSPSTSTASAPTCPPSSRSPRSTSSGHRGQRPGHRRRGQRIQDRPTQRCGHHQLHHGAADRAYGRESRRSVAYDAAVAALAKSAPSG